MRMAGERKKNDHEKEKKCGCGIKRFGGLALVDFFIFELLLLLLACFFLPCF